MEMATGVTNVTKNDYSTSTVATFVADNVTNANFSPEDVLGPRYHKRARIVIIIIMIVASVVGNSVVCWKLVVKRRHRRVSKARVLFLNLALADLLVACVTMTSQVVWEVMGRVWIAGDAFCRLFKFLQTFALVSSTYMLVAIALDRHIAIATALGTQPRSVEVGGHHVVSVVCALTAKRVKTLKMTAIVFGAFLVTNVPYMVQEVILAFGNPDILNANVDTCRARSRDTERTCDLSKDLGFTLFRGLSVRKTKSVAGPNQHTGFPVPCAAGNITPGHGTGHQCWLAPYLGALLRRDPCNDVMSKHLTLQFPSNLLTNSPSRESPKGRSRGRINLVFAQPKEHQRNGQLLRIEADYFLTDGAADSTQPLMSTTLETKRL
ncbi:hypothetical protein HPB50_015698 [Hyalomma asiaticum]|uniref:Uncharacterized protein n=1 Tax=Hyalomma asiaticum TaxID=266040 RepID=A0ACB7SYJ5_HYAAI|nr:hypothetical protein HPB50_015698 [Hyalomma asiaticum]